MSRAAHLARGSATGAALVAFAICAGAAAANPRGPAPAAPVYPSFPSAMVRHAHVGEGQPQLRVPQHQLTLPLYVPLAIAPFGFGNFGSGFMGGLPLGQCANASPTQQAPLTLGQLAPGGVNTGFAPVTQSLLTNGSASTGPSWLQSLTATTPFGLPQAPWQLAQSGTQGLSLNGTGTQAQRCSTPPAFDFSDLQVGN